MKILMGICILFILASTMAWASPDRITTVGDMEYWHFEIGPAGDGTLRTEVYRIIGPCKYLLYVVYHFWDQPMSVW